MAGPRCVPMTSLTSPRFAEKAQVPTAGLLPRPGSGSLLVNHCESFELTPAATFAEKAALFPQAAFVVGWDTAVRLIDPRYYAADAARRDGCLRALLERACRVVVGGRAGADGHFRTWAAGEEKSDPCDRPRTACATAA